MDAPCIVVFVIGMRMGDGGGRWTLDSHQFLAIDGMVLTADLLVLGIMGTRWIETDYEPMREK